MPRAYYTDVCRDYFGNPIPGALVEVREVGAGVPTPDTLFASFTSVATLGNPLVANAQGYFYAYLDATSSKDLRITAAGYVAQTVTVVFAVPPGVVDATTLAGETEAVARHRTRINSGGTVVERRPLNVVAGTEIALALSDDAANEEASRAVTVAPDAAVIYHNADQTIPSGRWSAPVLNTDEELAGVTHSGTSNALVVQTAGLWEVRRWWCSPPRRRVRRAAWGCTVIAERNGGSHIREVARSYARSR